MGSSSADDDAPPPPAEKEEPPNGWDLSSASVFKDMKSVLTKSGKEAKAALRYGEGRLRTRTRQAIAAERHFQKLNFSRHPPSRIVKNRPLQLKSPSGRR